eukprot:Nk52_evm7s316 gene=Nk52_evmTU7s316
MKHRAMPLRNSRIVQREGVKKDEVREEVDDEAYEEKEKIGNEEEEETEEEEVSEEDDEEDELILDEAFVIKMQQMRCALEEELQELQFQERVMEIDKYEAIHHPDPEFIRPELNMSDDDFTKEMKANGYCYRDKNNRTRIINAKDLPGELCPDTYLREITNSIDIS